MRWSCSCRTGRWPSSGTRGSSAGSQSSSGFYRGLHFQLHAQFRHPDVYRLGALELAGASIASVGIQGLAYGIMGTADAVQQYLWLFEEHNVLEFLVLAGDHLYRMDYERFIQAHRETDADITVAALPMDEKRATAFGLLKIDEEGRIIEFAEKPKGEQLKAMKADTTILGLDDERAKEMPYIASMIIYVVSKDVILDLLRDKFSGANDFGSEVIPGATSIGMRVQAHLYDGYWEDIGTIVAFYNANLGITKKPVPDFSFYDRSAPIYAQPRYLPPKMLDADVTDSVRLRLAPAFFSFFFGFFA
ncbi:glucose-1-phosphate adenylyltransferase small subunit 1, chloroplastic-like isoform X2 [Actinidia eriantha]|uniref:glucose-1-phosphate adenylyltransferase small subunit 1, chloroplastic-like isoform X2 n=1 Tax=Actinidia eriantha TaxID=165200 RepID=UPI00258F6336|nr:glucose-1-phosphate adenylyltransferase small subunit 1, chloroplastic-like isoform X2 [Actinidia eriantha]